MPTGSRVRKISKERAAALQAINSMTADLVDVYHELSELTQEGLNGVMDYHVKMGKKILQVQKDVDTYGSEAVHLLSKALLISDESTLRRDAKVMQLITDKDISKIKARNKEQAKEGGQLMSWSHLHTMTYKTHDRESMLAWVERVFDEDLSVRGLRELLGEDVLERAEPAVGVLPRGIYNKTDNIAARSTALSGIIDKYSEVFADEDLIQKASSDPDFQAKAQIAATSLRRLAENAIMQADNLSRLATPQIEASPAAPPAAPLETAPAEGKTRRSV